MVGVNNMHPPPTPKEGCNLEQFIAAFYFISIYDFVQIKSLLRALEQILHQIYLHFTVKLYAEFMKLSKINSSSTIEHKSWEILFNSKILVKNLWYYHDF